MLDQFKIGHEDAMRWSIAIMVISLMFVGGCTAPFRSEGPTDKPRQAPTDEPSGWVLIKAGSFEMGSPEDELGRDDDEVRHEVVISRSFLMKPTEVTQGEWREVTGTSPSYFSDCGDGCPVERVSWYDAVAYANELSRMEGYKECYKLSGCSGTLGGGCGEDNTFCDGDFKCDEVRFLGLDCEGYRLPTESEWEYAARAGTQTAFYNGGITEEGWEKDKNLDSIGWYSSNSGKRTHKVGKKPTNDWGLYDMSGNVWEWTWDWLGDYPTSRVRDPLGPENGSLRVYRGGGWDSTARYSRSASRERGIPSIRDHALGFRLVRSWGPAS